VTIYKSRL